MKQANCIKENCCIDGIYKRKWLYWLCKGKQSESLYLIGEQRQTCHILANQNTFQFWTIKIKGSRVKKMDRKRLQV